MYLSKVTFRREQIAHLAELLGEGAYAEHQLMWRLFPDNPRAERDFLFRKEEGFEFPFYYLLSQRKPLESLAGITVASKEYTPQLMEGDHLRFELRANAVKTTHDGSGSKRRIRRDIVEAAIDVFRSENEQSPPSEVIRQEAGNQWLSAQGVKHGFRVNQLNVSNHSFHRVKKPHAKQTVKFASMDFQGLLQIMDPDKFLAGVLRAGLGRSKSFGCGLMLLSRA